MLLQLELSHAESERERDDT